MFEKGGDGGGVLYLTLINRRQIFSKYVCSNKKATEGI